MSQDYSTQIEDIQQEPTSKKPFFRKWFFRTFWTFVIGGLLSVVLLFLLASWGVFGKLPSFRDLENPNLAVATEVISSDGQVLGKIYKKNRVNINYDNLPQHLVDAVVATEDVRFFKHSGIDFKGTFRALIFLGNRGGGSTITQQLAKNLLGQGQVKGGKVERLIGRVTEKAKEYIVALRLEKRYTKQEILAMYLNQFDFVNNAIGIQTASKVYFNKSVENLTIEEGAMFAGMLQNPSLHNPARYRSNPEKNREYKEKSRRRRNNSINQMAKYYAKGEISTPITSAVRDSLFATPILVDFNADDHNSGIAPYIRSVIQNDFLEKWVKDNPKVGGGRYDIYRDGLKVYTTIDSRMQRIAEDAVQEHLVYLQKEFDKETKRTNRWNEKHEITALELAISNSDRYNSLKRLHKTWTREKVKAEMKKKVDMTVYHPVKGEVDTLMSPMDSIKYHRLMLQSAFLATNPKTGQIKAWVGGRNFKHFKYDHVTSRRQVGSTMKPFLYSVAIDNGWSPCYTIPNMPAMVETKTGKIWEPKNSGKWEYDGRPLTLKYGLANSLNNVSAELIEVIGPRPVKQVAERAGMKDVPEVFSIALGTTEQTVLDMSKAYTTFANSGISTEPYVIERIEDKNGNVLAEFAPSKVEVMSAQTTAVMLEMMRTVVNKGTGRRLNFAYGLGDAYIVGKTGTTNDNTDGWFVGLTPNLIGIAWTGCDDPALRFINTTYGQGARAALPIWGRFFQKVYERGDEFGVKKTDQFKMPKYQTINMDCDDPMALYGQQVPGTDDGYYMPATTPGTTTIIVDGVPQVVPTTSSPTVTNNGTIIQQVPVEQQGTVTSGGVIDEEDEEEEFE